MTPPADSAPLYTPPRIVAEDRCGPAIFDQIMRQVEPYLNRAAAHIASDHPAVVVDLVQEARIALWDLDLGRFARRDAEYLRSILWSRMVDVYRAESWGGLTTGWSKHGPPAATGNSESPKSRRRAPRRRAAR